ncbi:heme exporter protein CcmD [Catenovulum sp. SM1970]|uniref:heme exporter protein CcmD n=1 Tax=Marinifaba aquimaris TaxID=2741323 RepID=UPI001573391C|nr:heme exporter protein CcmD [Marinifaba aquimaris]NTS76364.1 heme exporter protein CcmD [Marinifaba aquimaris]
MGQFASFADFIAMGTYGAYVWSGVFLCLALLVGLICWSKAQRKALTKEVLQQQEIESLRKEQHNSEMSL